MLTGAGPGGSARGERRVPPSARHAARGARAARVAVVLDFTGLGLAEKHPRIKIVTC